MNCTELSDLEEGEILEYESVSSNEFMDDVEIKKYPVKKGFKNSTGDCKENDKFCWSDLKKNDHTEGGYKKKLKLSVNLRNNKTNTYLVDLESVSSEEEYKSDYLYSNDTHSSRSEKWKSKRKRYGTVEDIMSEIGETICRKTHCKRKNLKNLKNLKSYEFWREKTFSNQIKRKRQQREFSLSYSESDKEKEKRIKRKKRRSVYYEKDEKTTQKPKVRDFDEVRKNLLENLQKQKAEEKLRSLQNEIQSEKESSEIQEVEMMIDCTNYVDSPSNAGPATEENEENEDELDLIQLRLIALASNKKQKKKEEKEKVEEREKNGEEQDLDRNELLLRAEALKTALLKKHEKRLGRLKVKKELSESLKTLDDVETLPIETELPDITEKEANRKENVAEDEKEKSLSSQFDSVTEDKNEKFLPPMDPKINQSLEATVNNPVPKKTPVKLKTKRKKRKSGSFDSNLKENAEEKTIEDDDRSLRSQLLSDLLKKKQLKNSNKKPVLLDSVQTSANQKPLPQPVKANLFKKVNVPKAGMKPPPAPVPASVPPKPNIQRIIVHLGSEDSSEEDEVSPSQNTAIAQTEPNKTVQSDYEKSVELLLSQARKNIERKKLSTTEKLLETPEAVYKHLPPSQRLEYIRLKQKLAEREKLKLQNLTGSSPGKPAINGQLNPEKETVKPINGQLQPEKETVKPINGQLQPEKETVKPTMGQLKPETRTLEPIIPQKINSPLNKNRLTNQIINKKNRGFPTVNGAVKIERKLVLNNTRGDSKKYVINGSKSVIETPKNKLLLPSSQALISKLKLLLRKIKMEKTIEENYEKEISKLRNQISVLERKKMEQRTKIKKLGEESMKTYKAIQGITAKTNEKEAVKISEKKSKITEEETEKLSVAKLKMASPEGKNEPDETEAEKETLKAQNNIIKELNNGDAESDEHKMEGSGLDEGGCGGNGNESGDTTSFCFLDYRSPLQLFRKESNNVDPNLEICPFDLMGVCKDEECGYQHLRSL